MFWPQTFFVLNRFVWPGGEEVLITTSLPHMSHHSGLLMNAHVSVPAPHDRTQRYKAPHFGPSGATCSNRLVWGKWQGANDGSPVHPSRVYSTCNMGFHTIMIQQYSNTQCNKGMNWCHTLPHNQSHKGQYKLYILLIYILLLCCIIIKLQWCHQHVQDIVIMILLPQKSWSWGVLGPWKVGPYQRELKVNHCCRDHIDMSRFCGPVKPSREISSRCAFERP